MEITAIIDGKVKIVSKASIRRHLKLEDFDCISNLPTTEIFEQLALMGNMRRASKVYTGVDIPLFPRMLVQGPVVQGEGSIVPVEPHHTPTSAPSTSQPPNRVVALEKKLQQTKKVYGTAFTKLIKKVKKLEKTIKTRQARRKARIVVSDDEEDFEDPSKQRRKIAEIDQDPDISLVQHDAEPVSTASASVSTGGASSAKDKGKAIMEEAGTIQTKTKLQLEQERLGYEEALRLQAEIDKDERQRIARVQEEASSFNIE
ncbi:hypothetical protein Tco_0755116 [Tanacetum coccineum]